MKTFLTSPGKEASCLYLCSRKAGMLFFFLMQVILSSSSVHGQRASWFSDYEKCKHKMRFTRFIFPVTVAAIYQTIARVLFYLDAITLAAIFLIFTNNAVYIDVFNQRIFSITLRKRQVINFIIDC